MFVDAHFEFDLAIIPAIFANLLSKLCALHPVHMAQRSQDQCARRLTREIVDLFFVDQ